MEINYMNGENFTLCPLNQLRLVWTSSLIGEPKYYLSENEATQQFMNTLSKALDYDYKAVLEFAVELRNNYHLRVSPQIILVEATLHPRRIEFNKTHPGFFLKIFSSCVLLPTDLYSQMEYFKKTKGSLSSLPNPLKKGWKFCLEKMSAYQLNKYKKQAQIVDLVRLSHPRSDKNPFLKDIIYNTLSVSDEQQTWENLRSRGKSWSEILTLLPRFPHMALLRNLRNIEANCTLKELEDSLIQLKKGVLEGKQFPFRYFGAYQEIEKSSAEDLDKKNKILNALEECMNLSLEQMPSLPGKVVCLCDNSGSAWGTFASKYGTQTVATIGNLSGLMTAMKATGGGQVGLFGDFLLMYNVSPTRGVLEQLKEVNEIGKKVGMGTENGLWLWFEDAFMKKKMTDHLFVYSDMQAGRGQLYGTNPSTYGEFGMSTNTRYLNVQKLLEHYRKNVNPSMTMFSVQTAGYKNNIVPELMERVALLTGWTGNEAMYASKMIEIWNQDREIELLKIPDQVEEEMKGEPRNISPLMLS